MKQFIAFTKKEFFHIFRDVRTMLILLVMPITLLVLFGYAITTEVRSAPFAVVDLQQDEESRRMIEQLSASEYFSLYALADNYAAAEQLMRRGEVRMIVVLQTDEEQPFQILSDATDPNEASTLSQYAHSILSQSPPPPSCGGTLRPVVHLLYNPTMKGAFNFVPGVMGLILILICAMMTSIGIVKEKEMGTMEILLVSPLKPIYIILAKAIPYLLMSMVNIATILLLARFLLDVPIKGSLWVVLLLSLLYSFVALCLGLLVSTLVDKQQSAMLICGMVLMLPVMLLSGMIFPIENMPLPLQILSNIVPAKWYIIALRDVMIKGLSWQSILPEIGILLLMMTVLIAVSVKRFKIRL